MKRHVQFGIPALLVGALCSLASCEKESFTDLAGTHQVQGASALRFADADALKQAVMQISKTKDKVKGLEQVRAAGLAIAPGGFSSLMQHKKNLQQSAASPDAAARGTATNTQTATAAGRAVESELALLDGLVPDPNFAAVLNEQMEVQVADKVYKITPQGTYFTSATNVRAMEDIIAARANNIEAIKQDKVVKDYLYQVAGDVYRYDTFGEAVAYRLPIDNEQPPEDCPGGCPPSYPTQPQPPRVIPDCSFLQPITNTQFSVSQDEYCGIETFAYGSKTVVGGWFQSIFGANSDRTVDFDGSHRVKVKLYNFNYFVYSSVGLKVKFQKQGWTGIWDARDTEKLVIGWDAMIFETPSVYSASFPYNNPSFPAKAIAKEILSFVNFNVNAGTLTQLDESLLGGRDLYGAKDVTNVLQNLSRQTLASATKTIWNYANKELNPGRLEFLDTETKAFRMIYPNKFTTVLSRWETSQSNSQEIDCIFDFNTCRITYNGYVDGGFDWFNNVAKPTYENKSFSYKVIEASIYGAAKYNGRWKGARIVQEKED